MNCVEAAKGFEWEMVHCMNDLAAKATFGFGTKYKIVRLS